MAELAEDNLDFAAAPHLEPAPDAAPVRAPSMSAANASAFVIPQIAPEDCEPDPLADDTRPIDAFNDGGGKPGREESADKKSKRYFIELATLNNIGGNGGGPLNQETPEERQARLRAEIDRLFDEVKEREERREREREFDAKMHQIGSYQFSGKELMEMKAYLDDPENVKRVEDELMQKTGMSKDEAKKKVATAKRLLELEEKERSGKLTEQEKIELREGKKLPGMGETLDIVRNQVNRARDVAVKLSQSSVDKWAGARQESISSRVESVAGTSFEKNDIKQFKETLELLKMEREGSLSHKDSLRLTELRADPNNKDIFEISSARAATNPNLVQLTSDSPGVMAASSRDVLPQTRNLTKEFSEAGNPNIVAKTPEPVVEAKFAAANKVSASEISL